MLVYYFTVTHTHNGLLATDTHTHTYRRQGLLFFNDSRFTEEDFESVISLGSSKKLADVGRIGKYGLGMNSASETLSNRESARGH